LNSIQNIDILIAGGGLAGMCLALECKKIGLTVVLIDDIEKNHSSSVAAGIFNPLTGRKIRRTWMAKDAFEKLHAFYNGIQDQTGGKFFNSRPLVRVFPNVKVANDWDAEEGGIFSSPFSPSFPDYINGNHGGVLVNQTGYLNIKEFFSSAREILGERSFQVRSSISKKNIRIGDGSVSWNNYRAKKIIFCEVPQ